jgi:hypothetical protein
MCQDAGRVGPQLHEGDSVMGLFSKKSSTPSPSAVGRGSAFIGRKFTSSLSLAECITNYEAARDECYETEDGPSVDPGWDVPAVEGLTSSQGDVVLAAPERVLMTHLRDGGHLYLSIWDGPVSYGDGTGPGTEMWFVPPGFDTSPIAIAGTWKRRDSSLSSIGYVEASLWGAR